MAEEIHRSSRLAHARDRPVSALTVRDKQWLSPGMIRVWFDAPGFVGNEFTDAYVKLIFDPNGPHLDKLPERPITRTYTVRSHDPANETLALDFVAHGSSGLAGPWALNAREGHQILARGPGGRWTPPAADYHLFVGDESAVPAIARALEVLPPDSRGQALLETRKHPIPLTAPPGIDLRWFPLGDDLYRKDRLALKLACLDTSDFESISVFAHGERGAMKALRPILRNLGIKPELISISGYWALGRAEDQFQAEKKTEFGRIQRDSFTSNSPR